MNTRKPKWDVLDAEERTECLDMIIARILDTPAGAVGLIMAEDILAIVSEKIGPVIYNKALSDSRKVLDEKIEDLAVDLDILRQQ